MANPNTQADPNQQVVHQPSQQAEISEQHKPAVLQSEQVNRVTAYIDTLRQSGAPHQQELAEDLASMIGYHKNPVPQVAVPPDGRDEQIKNLQDNVSKLIDARDTARKQLGEAERQFQDKVAEVVKLQATLDDTKQLLDNATRNFEVRERDLQAQLEQKTHGIAKDVPQEEHVSLKETTTSKPKHK